VENYGISRVIEGGLGWEKILTRCEFLSRQKL